MFGKSANWWFGKNSLFKQIMPNEQKISVGGFTLGTVMKSPDNITNIENSGFDLDAFLDDPRVKKYMPYVLAYLILKR